MDDFRSLREEKEGGAAGRDRAAGMEAGGFQMVYGKKGKKEKGAASVEVYGVEGAVDAGGGCAVKVASKDKKTTAPRSQVPFHIPTIPRPQDEFKILVNNSNQPFEHVWLERSEDDSRFVHPLEKLPVLDFLDGNIGDADPVKPPPVVNTPFKLVEGVKELKELAAKLRKVDEFSVDLEHNQYRFFQGLTCLMQISTRTEDFIVDTLKLRVHVGPHLREFFKDPSKRKVMHGADRDILWLQRDFGVYVSILFQAAGEGVEDDSEFPSVIEEHASSETATMDGAGSLERTEEMSASKVARSDDPKPGSSSVTGSSFEPSNNTVISNGEKLDHGLVLSLQAKAVNVASVQTLKKPTSPFRALFGNSSTKRKLDPDSKGRNAEQDKADIKLEQIKSSVTLPFHSFSGGVGGSMLESGPTITNAKPQQPEPLMHQENEPRLAAELDDS